MTALIQKLTREVISSSLLQNLSSLSDLHPVSPQLRYLCFKQHEYKGTKKGIEVICKLSLEVSLKLPH